MRTFAFFGAATILALAGQARAEGNGYVGAAYLSQELEAGPVEIEADGWGAEGAIALEASPKLGLQLHGVVIDNDSDENIFSADAHLNARNSNHLIGVFGAFDNAADSTTWAIGGEGELYMNDVTLAAAAGYLSNDDSEAEAWTLDGEVRFFVSENFRIEGEVGYLDESDTDDEGVVRVGAGGEYQLASSPFSIFANYSHSETDEPEASVDAISIGGRFNFGGSLLDRDRKGASLPGLSRATRSLENP